MTGAGATGHEYSSRRSAFSLSPYREPCQGILSFRFVYGVPYLVSRFLGLLCGFFYRVIDLLAGFFDRALFPASERPDHQDGHDQHDDDTLDQFLHCSSPFSLDYEAVLPDSIQGLATRQDATITGSLTANGLPIAEGKFEA
jgi:hypothetical protein